MARSSNDEPRVTRRALAVLFGGAVAALFVPASVDARRRRQPVREYGGSTAAGQGMRDGSTASSHVNSTSTTTNNPTTARCARNRPVRAGGRPGPRCFIGAPGDGQGI